MQPVQTGTRRDIFGGNFKYLDGDWTFSGALRHEHKEGSMEESFDRPWGGRRLPCRSTTTPTATMLTAAYNTRLNQVMLQYTFSHFHDNNLFVTIPYPISNTRRHAPVFRRRRLIRRRPATRPLHHVHDGNQRDTEHAHQSEPARRPGNAGRHVPAEHRRSQSLRPIARFSNLNSYLQGTSNTSLNAIARVFQGKVSAGFASDRQYRRPCRITASTDATSA